MQSVWDLCFKPVNTPDTTDTYNTLRLHLLYLLIQTLFFIYCNVCVIIAAAAAAAWSWPTRPSSAVLQLQGVILLRRMEKDAAFLV